MNRTDVVTALEKALAEVLDGPVETELTESVKLFDDLHLDSTTMLETLMWMEESMGLEVEPEELDIDDFQTVGTFTDFVLRELNERGRS